MALALFTFSETSPAAPGTSASSASVGGAANYLPAGVAGPLDDFEAIDIAADLVGATGGTLDVYVQYSPNAGSSWYDIVHFTQLAAGATAIRVRAPISLYTNLANPFVVGKNLVPALAPSTIVNGAFCDRVRLVMVAGSGTTAGAAVVVTVNAQRPYARAAG